MKKIRYRWTNQSLRTYEEIDVIDIVITKTKIAIQYGNNGLMIKQNQFKNEGEFNLNEIFSTIKFPKTEFDFDAIMLCDGFHEEIWVDSLHFENATLNKKFTIPFVKKLNKLFGFDVVETFTRQFVMHSLFSIETVIV